MCKVIIFHVIIQIKSWSNRNSLTLYRKAFDEKAACMMFFYCFCYAITIERLPHGDVMILKYIVNYLATPMVHIQKKRNFAV